MLKILVVLNSLLCSSVVAAAIDVEKTIHENTTEFRYQRPPEAALLFVLDNQDIKKQSGTNRRYSAELAELHVLEGCDEAIDILLTGEAISIAFNPTFLADGLQAVGTPFVQISFTGSNKPAILMGKNEATGNVVENYRYLLMPMRYAS